jgi:hypothetical protein
MKESKRAIRRHHATRLITRWKHRILSWYDSGNYSTDWIFLNSRRMATTPCHCSTCAGHINPRKWNGELTRQEKINNINFREYEVI